METKLSGYSKLRLGVSVIISLLIVSVTCLSNEVLTDQNLSNSLNWEYSLPCSELAVADSTLDYMIIGGRPLHTQSYGNQISLITTPNLEFDVKNLSSIKILIGLSSNILDQNNNSKRLNA